MEQPVQFKQNNPKDQSVVILQSIYGWISNLDEGISDKETVVMHIKKNINELQLLHNWLKPNW